MADTYRLRKGDPKSQVYPKDTTTTAIEVGDMVKIASGEISPVSAATDNLALRGVAMTSSAAGSSDEVTVYEAAPDAEWDFDLDTATTVASDDEVAISAAQAVTKQTTDAVAVVTESGTSVSVARIKFKRPAAYIGDAS